ncbi:MAG: flagellar basal body rod protein FlgB [Clostridiales bacterium]|jgi:flagellar basal-body rod protein FlgB|nr:flagellar basal body rod protein FlgB [Clostridiales bacterium]
MLERMFSSVNTLQKALNASWLRNEVIGNNIANVDTPGFKASHVRFEELVSEALNLEGRLRMTVTDEKHIPSTAGGIENVAPEVVKDETTTTRLDGNNVNIDNEMVEMAKNSINYYAAVTKVNSEFRKLNTAINVN